MVKCCRGVLWGSVVEKCCEGSVVERVLWRSVAEKWCGEAL